MSHSRMRTAGRRLTSAAMGLLLIAMSGEADTRDASLGRVGAKDSVTAGEQEQPKNTRDDFAVDVPPKSPTVTDITRTKGEDVIFVFPEPKGEKPPTISVPIDTPGKKPVTFSHKDHKDIVVEWFCEDLKDGVLYRAPFDSPSVFGANEGETISFWGCAMAIIVENCENAKFLQLITSDEVEIELHDGTKKTAKMNVSPMIDSPAGTKDPVGPGEGDVHVLEIAAGIRMQWDTPGLINPHNGSGRIDIWGFGDTQIACKYTDIKRFRETTKFCKVVFC